MFRLGCNRTERLLLIPREVDASWASSLWRLCFHNERLVQYIPTVHFYLSCCLKRISFRMPARKSITVWIQQNFIRFSEKMHISSVPSEATAKLRSTTRPFVQWSLILGHLKHSKLTVVSYTYRIAFHRLKRVIGCASAWFPNCMRNKTTICSA